MKDLTKRSLSILTAVLMLMCMLPVAANAHGIEAVPQAQANGAAPRTETELSIPELDPETVAVKARGYADAHTQTMPEGVAIWDGSTADAFAGGSGKDDDPFLISNGSQLAYLASLVNGHAYQNGKYFKLTDDIYLNDITDWENWDTTAPANSWTSIGYYWYYGFAGNFDGDGHAVYGIYINTTATDDTGEFKGLFGCCLSGASVQNLGIECSYINACKKLAGVIGYNLGEVKNCYSNAKIVCSDENAGGIIGYNERGAFVSGCYNSGTVISSSDYACDLGGIIGESGGGLSHEPITIVTDCYNSGTIGKPAAYKTYETGGIAGTCSAQVSHCYNSGTVYGYSEVGGIICELSQAVARDCLNEGDIIQDPSTADDYAEWYGGIAGKVQEGTVINCVNKGNVSGEKQLGGIAGTIYWVSHIYSCRNDGVVSGTADCVGGIGGILLSSMCSIGGCINNGTVNAAGQYAGGIIGSNNSAKISDCVNNGAVTSGGSYTGGIAGANIMDSSEAGDPKPVIGFCVNKAEINGAGNVGGLTGANGGIINDCYNTAGITGTSAVSGGIGAADAVSENINLYNIGAAPQGIIGAAENGASISGCYYLDTCAPGSTLGTALTDAQMKTQSGFDGFDFENVWIMGTDDYLYPVLANKYNVAFFDIITGDEIPGCYAVTPGSMLNEADFPPVPEHEGCEFLRWDSRYDVTNDLDYSNTPIYGDIIVKARYYDSNANWISGWSGGSIPACELHEPRNGIWSFAEYDMETIYFKHEIERIEAVSYAGGNLYGFFNNGNDHSFFIMDPETYEITKYGDNANILVNAMAYNHADGIMYAVADESGWAGDSKLYTVDLDTSAITFLADLKSEGTPLTIACFAIDGEGRAYAISNGSDYGGSASNFYSVNLETGECSLISGLGLESINQYFSCLCWDHNENRLLLSWYGYQVTGGNGIFTVDPATGALTALGQVGPECFMGCGLNFTAIWTADDLPMEPVVIEHPDCNVTFIDGLTNEEIPGGYAVEWGSVLNPADFPAPPKHNGYLFTDWDYNDAQVYEDITITAGYTDHYGVGYYFETDPADDGWTMEDHDNDTHTWIWYYGSVPNDIAIPEGQGCMSSASWTDEWGGLTPDNWLISPEFTCGYSLDFLIISDSQPEPVGVYISTDGGENWSGELRYFEANNTVQTCSVDLSQYEGQNVKLAFRHYNVTDHVSVNLDAVVITYHVPEVSVNPGDYDCDGNVDTEDALLTLRAAMELITPSEQSQLNADMDGDGKLTAADALTILRMAMGLL